MLYWNALYCTGMFCTEVCCTIRQGPAARMDRKVRGLLAQYSELHERVPLYPPAWPPQNGTRVRTLHARDLTPTSIQGYDFRRELKPFFQKLGSRLNDFIRTSIHDEYDLMLSWHILLSILRV